MSRTFNVSNPANVTMSAINYDPLAHLSTILPNPKLYGPTVSSLAWYIDRTLVSEVRNMFYRLYDDMSEATDSSIDSFSSFVNTMNEQEQRETNLVEQGYSSGSGARLIQLLVGLRDEFHSTASAASERHKVPTIEQLMLEDKPMKIDSLSRAKTVALAKHMAKGDAAVEAKFTTELLLRKERRAIDMHERRLELVPALTGMLRFIGNRSTISDPQFHDLPAALQKRLVEQLAKIISRSVAQASDDRTVDEIEYIKIMIEGEGAIEAIQRVLAQHTFTQLDDPVGQVAQAYVRAKDQQEQLDAALAPA